MAGKEMHGTGYSCPNVGHNEVMSITSTDYLR